MTYIRKCRDIGVGGHSPGWDLGTGVPLLVQLPRHLGKSFNHVSLSLPTLKIKRFSRSLLVLQFGLRAYLPVLATHLAHRAQAGCLTLKCIKHSRAGVTSVPGVGTCGGFSGGSGLPPHPWEPEACTRPGSLARRQNCPQYEAAGLESLHLH